MVGDGITASLSGHQKIVEISNDKVEQKTRGSLCNVVVKNVEVKYKVKYGFSG